MPREILTARQASRSVWKLKYKSSGIFECLRACPAALAELPGIGAGAPSGPKASLRQRARHPPSQQQIKHQHGQMQPPLRVELSEKQRAHQFDCGVQGQHLRQPLQRLRQRGQRKINAGQKRHRREHQGEVVGEKIIAARLGVDDETDGGKHQPGEQQQGQRDEQRPLPADAQNHDDRKNGHAAEHGLGRRPGEFAQQHVVERGGGDADGVPGFLHMHA